ncbi:MAG: hypothetical protein K6E59_06620 [Bacilli bacterium]|nr:hypothetical protein [Bacilli bacterium]
MGQDLDVFVSSLPEQLRLGHVVERDGGEIVVFVSGEYHAYHVYTTGERLSNAFDALFRFDLGQAQMGKTSVASLIGLSLGRSALAFAVLGLPGISGLFGRRVKKGNVHTQAIGYGLSGVSLLLSHVFVGLAPTLYYLGVALTFLSASAFCYTFCQGKDLRIALRVGALSWAACLLNAFFLGVYPSSVDIGLSGLFFAALKAGDNHVYSFALPLCLLGLAIPLDLSLLSLLWPKKVAQAVE